MVLKSFYKFLCPLLLDICLSFPLLFTPLILTCSFDSVSLYSLFLYSCARGIASKVPLREMSCCARRGHIYQHMEMCVIVMFLLNLSSSVKLT